MSNTWTPKQTKLLIKAYETKTPLEILEEKIVGSKTLDAIKSRIKLLKRKGMIPQTMDETEFNERRRRAYDLRNELQRKKSEEKKSKIKE